MGKETIELTNVVQEHFITVTENTMVPEDGGYFAYHGDADPDRTRGYGDTPWEAIECLAELMVEITKPEPSPCPFCGREPGKEGVFYSPPEDSVICMCCQANGPIGSSEVDAINKWNSARMVEWVQPERG